MGDWLDSLLAARADTVVVQAFEHVTLRGDTLPLRNFLARFHPEAADRVMLLAHWDTRPHADAAGSTDSTVPVPGANDGGSGVAVLLGVADAIAGAGGAPRGVDLLFVDGEDFGIFADSADVLIGSTWFARHLPAGPRPRYAVLLDLVGAPHPRFAQEGYSLTGAPDVVRKVWDTAERLGHGAMFPSESGIPIKDDHLPLQRAGIPAVDVIDLRFLSGAIWHTADDTPDKVSAATLQAVGEVMLALLWEDAR
jgi:Zn-dependent M28 family amino/carboxypeptidase